MVKALALGGLLMAPLTFIGCMESNAPTAPGADKTPAPQTGLSRTLMEEAFPGRTGEWKEGYYRGEHIAYQVIDGKNVLDADIVLDDSEITSTPSLQKGAGAASSSSI